MPIIKLTAHILRINLLVLWYLLKIIKRLKWKLALKKIILIIPVTKIVNIKPTIVKYSNVCSIKI